MNLFLATNNPKKLTEMQRILNPIGVNVITAKDLKITLSEVEETGSTFEENAELKARSAMLKTGLPSVADDSGLMVDFLNGEPGVYSARYAGEHGNDKKNNSLLLSKLNGVSEKNRSAHYVCAICCIFPNGVIITAKGECYGKIGFECLGNSGFGYDPLFIINGKSFGQYSDEEKDKISHRGKALRLFAKKLENAIQIGEI